MKTGEDDKEGDFASCENCRYLGSNELLEHVCKRFPAVMWLDGTWKHPEVPTPEEEWCGEWKEEA